MARSTSPDDRELARLMSLAQAGDRAAYARVLRACMDIIGALAAADGSPRTDVTVADCLRTIHAARHTFDPKRSFVVWVVAIARRHGLSHRT